MIDSVGGSSLELSRTSKGEYSYCLKVYFSGTTISAMKTVIDRIITVKEYLEKKLDIGKAGVDDV
jgi:hypothetical protein